MSEIACAGYEGERTVVKYKLQKKDDRAYIDWGQSVAPAPRVHRMKFYGIHRAILHGPYVVSKPPSAFGAQSK